MDSDVLACHLVVRVINDEIVSTHLEHVLRCSVVVNRAIHFIGVKQPTVARALRPLL